MLLSGLAPRLLPRCSFPRAGTSLDVGVSGGKDSLALLVLAVAAGCRVTAYHVDHGLRPGSAAEAEVVAGAASSLGASFVALSAPCSPGPNLEARAREARLGALPDGVSLGHTADDQAETILLNLLRGAGLDGLAAMRVGPRHPILALRRREAAELVDSLELEAVADPSNEDRRFLRNRVRFELLPLLCELSGRDLVPVLCRQSQLLAEERDLLEELSASIDASDTSALRAAAPALGRRALRRWLREEASLEHPFDLAAIERVLAVARGEAVACELSGARRVRRSHGRLLLTSAPRPGEGDPPRGPAAAPG